MDNSFDHALKVATVEKQKDVLEKQMDVVRTVSLLKQSAEGFLSAFFQCQIAQMQASQSSSVQAFNDRGAPISGNEKAANMAAAKEMQMAAKGMMGNLLSMCRELLKQHELPQAPKLAE